MSPQNTLLCGTFAVYFASKRTVCYYGCTAWRNSNRVSKKRTGHSGPALEKHNILGLLFSKRIDKNLRIKINQVFFAFA